MLKKMIFMEILKHRKIEIHTGLQYLMLILLIFFVFFLKLGAFHMRWWDGSVFAVNSYEMLHNGKFFSLYFDNHPDLFNFKPPFTCWIQIVFIKLLGYNELSLRLPSAIAAGLSVIVMFRFVSQKFNFVMAWISALILMTSVGFVTFHTSRTADSDALLTFFLLMANLYFLQFLMSNNKVSILLFFVFLTLAFFTKSFAALFFTPAYAIIILKKRLLKQFTLNGYFISGLFFLLIVAFGFLYLRALDNPGYIKAFLFSDASRIYNGIWSEHKHETLFYFYNLFDTRFSIWSVFFVIGAVLMHFNTNKSHKQIFYFFFLLIGVYLLIITISVTKLIWYDMPLYPYLSVIAAYPIFLLVEGIVLKEKPLTVSMKYLIIAVFFFYPYFIIFNKSQGNTIPNGERLQEANENFINRKINKHYSLEGVKVYYQGWKGSLLFYKYKLAEKNENIELVDKIEHISVNEKIMVCNDSLKKVLSDKFNLQPIDSCLNSVLYVTSQKQTN